MGRQIWVGVDPGTKITGVCLGIQRKGKLEVHSTVVQPNTKYGKNEHTRLALLRNGFQTVLRGYRDDTLMGLCIEDPMGVKGNAVVLHEVVGLYIVTALDMFGWDDSCEFIYRVTQPMLKKFAINGNPKRDEAIMKMSARADKEYNFTAERFADEVMAFWCMMFAKGMTTDPVEKFRLDTIMRYKKKKGL